MSQKVIKNYYHPIQYQMLMSMSGGNQNIMMMQFLPLLPQTIGQPGAYLTGKVACGVDGILNTKQRALFILVIQLWMMSFKNLVAN